MRPTLDFSPLFRSSIGFDRMLNALEAANRLEPTNTWPPYDIVKSGEDNYRIAMAVAGFSLNDLTITQEQNLLTVAGERAGADEGEYLHRGIPEQAFRQRFQLADHVKVAGASLVDGLLTIDLKREIPEEMKPRQIAIASDGAIPADQVKQIEAGKQAA